MTLSVAIMQPTYLPWLGYFALMEQVDMFVFLDDVQFDRRSWQQRNRIKLANGPNWLTVPVCSKGRRDQRIDEVLIDDTKDFPQIHLLTLKHGYGKASYFEPFFPEIVELLERNHTLLCDLNIAIIKWMQQVFEIETRCIRSCDMEIHGVKVDRLVSICQGLGADRYLSPPGARGYLEESDAFTKAGIELSYHDYEHPAYPQLHGEFVPHLSAVDLMMNAGPDSLSIIRSGVVK